MKPTDQHRENETLAEAIERLAQEKTERDPLLTDQGKIEQRTDEPELVPDQITGEMLLAAAEAMIGRQPYVLGADYLWYKEITTLEVLTVQNFVLNE